MNEYLSLLGIEAWSLRPEEEIGLLKGKLAGCELCALATTRTQIVFGEGNLQSEVVFIGEAPGEQEDLQGRPFVGKAGQLLTKMLAAIDIRREEVYITNILKCRPPGNRNPYPTEIQHCTCFLRKQLSFIGPKRLVALGKVAANYLLNTEAPMHKLRGNWYEYELSGRTIPLLVTYHPAYLLRSPREKEKAYSDFLKLKEILEHA